MKSALYTVTYSQPLTATPTREVILALPNLEFKMGKSRMYLWIELYDQTASQFRFSLDTAAATDITNLVISYLSVDPAFTSSFSCSYFLDEGLSPLVYGPGSITSYINFTASTGVVLNMAHENVMLAFLHIVDLYIWSGCF